MSATNQIPPRSDEPDFYVENGCVVFTAAYHLRRGSCCESGCRHCPFGNAPSDTATKVQPPADDG